MTTALRGPAPAAVLVMLLLAALPAAAQDEAAADSLGAAVDSTLASQDMGIQPPGGYRGQDVPVVTDGPFLVSLRNMPKGGVKATVQQYQYYGQWDLAAVMRDGISADNHAGWSWTDYRKQDKTIERREDQFSWNAGQSLPVTATILGNWDWSEDRTVNSASVSNLAARNYKRGSLNLSKSRLRTGDFVHSLRGIGQIEDQKSINLGQRNDFTEGTGSLGAQTGWEIAPGLVLAGRLYGTATSGTRSLGESDSPSSANGDTIGLGVYYEHGWAGGRVHVSQGNFEKRYLDYRRNFNGLIDTVGVGEGDKVLQEIEMKDAVSLEFENTMRLGRLKLDTSLARDMDDLEYAASGVGRKERQNDAAAAALSFAAGRDSFTVNFGYVYKWDDQRYKNATTNRGKQYTKGRDLAFGWYRELFQATDLTVKLHQGLTQDIAQDQFNDNDKDRLDSDANVKIDRAWSGFRTSLGFNYKQVKDIAIREARSSNNNVKDSYEIAPGYTWDLADWLMLTQSYRLYIQYTDYLYSDLPSVTRRDDYSKRGNLNTRMTIDATERVEITLKHDYNKRFNATKTGTDASGSSSYFKDQIQSTNKIELGLKYKAAPGVILEAATFRTKDIKDTYGTTTRRTTTFSGEIWVGAQVRKKWGRTSPLELSAAVRKYNAYGPSVTPTSADYWDADVWLKWSF
ncbi:MAG TPA: hypothetical protein PLQ13_03040 [Candidatus Krumholzibacteria bacterium]|nr:hypothetical protein [Candidatus Krumholzibacteria bacterium]